MDDSQGLGIAAVERETGLSKDLLRIWERRYGFPQPHRDGAGDRLYPQAQVQRLRLLKRLLDLGHRPARIVPLTEAALQALLGTAQAALPSLAQSDPFTQTLLDLVKSHRVDEFRQRLAQQVLRMGLGRAVTEWLGPMTQQVGELWMRGEWAVFEEHLYSECLQQVLRQAIQTVPLQQRQRPRVLLSTLPGEAHELGLLMAEAMLTLEGCHCQYMGVQTPVQDLVRAAEALQVDIVALSFSSYLSPAAVQQGLEQLREQLPGATELWAGGSSVALKRAPDEGGMRCVTRLQDIAAEVQRWRSAAGQMA